ncbi:MAG: hypothetical protein D6698_01815 [Gammaproteobacteria bacterium]|nr:MAG: hypothetical protein D6698_01815 [Gammaproteobacteria bacterium]
MILKEVTMERRRIETEEHFHQAMAAVQSSIELLDVWDWDAWLMAEMLVRHSNPEMTRAMENDPQWDLKVGVMRAASAYMKTIRDLRAPWENPNEE